MEAPSPSLEEWKGLNAAEPVPELGPSHILPFYRKHGVLLTGVTGFVGKVVLWKLLKTCGPKIVYVIIREKRNQSPQERFDKEVLKSPIFKDFPEYVWRERVRVIHGDVIEQDLGLSPENKQAVINDVNIILHGAATTRFNEHIKAAMRINTLGVRNVMRLARKCRNLVSLVHVSTAYVNYPAKNGEVQEAIFSKSYDVGSITKRVLQMDDAEAEAKTPTIIAPYPNTYSYTKHLGENLLLQERKYTTDSGHVRTLPVCVVRPTIIVPAVSEPLPGWVDTMIGPAGLSVAGALGFLRFVRADPNFIVDFVPVDYVSNAIIAAAWANTVSQTATLQSETSKKSLVAHDHHARLPAELMPIYHIATSAVNPTTWRSLNKFASAYFRLYRPKQAVGPDPWNVMTPSKPLFETAHMLLHVLPASLMDLKLMVAGKKTKMVKLADRLHGVVDQLQPFTLNYWLFLNDNATQMWNGLGEQDKTLFNFDVANLNWPKYYMTYCEGLRRYLLKETHLPLTAVKTHQATSLASAAAKL